MKDKNMNKTMNMSKKVNFIDKMIKQIPKIAK